MPVCTIFNNTPKGLYEKTPAAMVYCNTIYARCPANLYLEHFFRFLDNSFQLVATKNCSRPR